MLLFSKSDYRSRYGRTLWQTDGGGGAGGSGGAGAGGDGGGAGGAAAGAAAGGAAGSGGGSGAGGDAGGEVKFTPEQQAFINAKISSERKAAHAAGKTEAETAAQAQKDADAAAAATKDLEAKGQYETAKAGLEGQVKAATDRADAAEALVKRYEGSMSKQIEALEGEIPAEALEDYDKEAAAIDRYEYLTRQKRLVEKLAPLAKKGGAGSGSGAGGGSGSGGGANPLSPTPGGTDDDEFDEEAARKATSGSFAF